ncbi:MAG: hypothetical protein ACYST5_14425, partial [Planctomycetota bacterium]
APGPVHFLCRPARATWRCEVWGGYPNSSLAPFRFSSVHDSYCLAFSWANPTAPPVSISFWPSWRLPSMAITLPPE